MSPNMSTMTRLHNVHACHAKALVCRGPLLCHHHHEGRERQNGRRACPDDAHAAAAAAVGRLEHDREAGGARKVHGLPGAGDGGLGARDHGHAAFLGCCARLRLVAHALRAAWSCLRPAANRWMDILGHRRQADRTPKAQGYQSLVTKASAKYGARQGGDMAAFPRLCLTPPDLEPQASPHFLWAADIAELTATHITGLLPTRNWPPRCCSLTTSIAKKPLSWLLSRSMRSPCRGTQFKLRAEGAGPYVNGLWPRANEGDALLLAAACKVSILGQEAVARVNAVCALLPAPQQAQDAFSTQHH